MSFQSLFLSSWHAVAYTLSPSAVTVTVTVTQAAETKTRGRGANKTRTRGRGAKQTQTAATATQTAEEEANQTTTSSAAQATSTGSKKNLQKYEGHVGDILAPAVIQVSSLSLVKCSNTDIPILKRASVVSRWKV